MVYVLWLLIVPMKECACSVFIMCDLYNMHVIANGQWKGENESHQRYTTTPQYHQCHTLGHACGVNFLLKDVYV